MRFSPTFLDSKNFVLLVCDFLLVGFHDRRCLAGDAKKALKTSFIQSRKRTLALRVILLLENEKIIFETRLVLNLRYTLEVNFD